MESGADVQKLDVLLRIEAALSPPIATRANVARLCERELVAISSFDRCSRRLVALTLEASAAGCSSRSEVGDYARARILRSARVAGLACLDLPSPSADEDSVREAGKRSKADGFSGLMTSRPEDVAILNEILATTP